MRALQRNILRLKTLNNYKKPLIPSTALGDLDHNVAYISYGNDGEATLNFCRRYELIENNREELNKQDRTAIITAYNLEIAAFEKRLNTYSKRYGLSKMHTVFIAYVIVKVKSRGSALLESSRSSRSPSRA